MGFCVRVNRYALALDTGSTWGADVFALPIQMLQSPSPVQPRSCCETERPRRHAPSDQPHIATAGAPCALKPCRHPTLRMTTDTGCGRGRFDPNRRVFAATV